MIYIPTHIHLPTHRLQHHARPLIGLLQSVQVYMGVCMCVYIYIYICVCVCVCTFAYACALLRIGTSALSIYLYIYADGVLKELREGTSRHRDKTVSGIFCFQVK